MAQTYNIEMNRYNGTDYDTLYPKTNIGNVDGINGAVSNVMQSNLTASRAMVTDGNGKVAASAVTAIELGYLDGVTSNVQTQINAKATKSSGKPLTLTAAGWSDKTQTVSVSGMTSDLNIVVAAAPESYIAYANAGVRCTTQTSNALVFVCETVPTEDLAVNVLIVG